MTERGNNRFYMLVMAGFALLGVGALLWIATVDRSLGLYRYSSGVDRWAGVSSGIVCIGWVRTGYPESHWAFDLFSVGNHFEWLTGRDWDRSWRDRWKASGLPFAVAEADKVIFRVHLFWMIFPLAWFELIAALRLKKRHRRIAKNVCPTCGYDLRATPARCPECGDTPTV